MLYTKRSTACIKPRRAMFKSICVSANNKVLDELQNSKAFQELKPQKKSQKVNGHANYKCLKFLKQTLKIQQQN